MSIDININNKKGVTLNTAKTYCEEDIVITIDKSLFEQDYSNEDGLVTRTLSYYYNDRVTSLGDRIFQNYSTSITIECPNVTLVGTNCFYNSSGVQELKLPKLISVTANALYQMTSIRVFNFPSVESVPNNTCRYCTGLEIVYMPKLSVLTPALFADCTKLHTFIIEGNSVVAMQNSNCFLRTAIESGNGYIYVPDNLVDSYKTTTNWSTYATQIKGISEIPQEIREELGI